MAGRTISTDATARREHAPERAVVEATAVGGDESAAAARENARALAAAVREALGERLDSPDRITTTDLRVERSSQAFDADHDDPYRAVERLRVECAPGAVADAVVAASDAGAAVPTVEFGLSAETRDRLEADALDDAMARARATAERIAAAEGLGVGGVLDVTVESTSTGMQRIVDEALAANRDAELHPSPVAVAETVDVTYELVER